MSKRIDMIRRIQNAMPEDEEVQSWCAREIERAGKSASKTAERYDIALSIIKNHAMEPVCAKEFAREVNSTFGKVENHQDWNTRTGTYYLRQLVINGIAEEVHEEGKKTGPKMYIYVG